MKEDGKAKQQIVDHIKDVSNILITVNQNPSVDELAAALGLTLMLNKMDKYGTAVFSGEIPPAIDFLKPEKTFRENVDNLRDFIVALDKDKADRLRYKVEDDLVRIFITPYKDPLTESDLEYSYGDFNVELVVALGVEKREDLDKAITAHGRILHDATVVTVNTQGSKSDLGTVDWQDEGASSYCEMLMSLSEALDGKLLDEQISNALLTGIVSATDRFSNTHTSPRVMTMAAQLMAAGANQQLIAARLEEAEEISPSEEGEAKDSKETGEKKSEKAASNGSIEIDHSKDEEEKEKEFEKALSKNGPKSGDSGKLSVDEIKKDLEEASEEKADKSKDIKSSKGRYSWKDKEIQPVTGGTLNATAAEAEEAKRREEQEARNKVILSHGKSIDPGEKEEVAKSEVKKPEGTSLAELEAAVKKRNGETADPEPSIDDLLSEKKKQLKEEAETKSSHAEAASPEETKPAEQPAELPPPPPLPAAEPVAETTPTIPEVDHARKEVEEALSAMPFNPANNPTASVESQPLPMPPPPPMPDFSQLPPPPPPLPSMDATAQGGLPPQEAPTPTSKPVAPPPIPAAESNPAVSPPPAGAPAASPSDPGQFRIPGQQ